MKESELGDGEEYNEGDIIDMNLQIQNDAICQLSLVHQDHVYCVTQVPQEPYTTFISGDGKDKCFIWKVVKDQGNHKCLKVGELEGHTETLEHIKFNHDGKLCITGGMNNVLRVWKVERNLNAGPNDNDFTFELKIKLENGPSANEDINIVEWHPKGNAVLCGGKDFSLYLLNGASGDFLSCFSGH